MFTRVVEITSKTGKARDLTRTVNEKILTILKNQPGFLDEITLVSDEDPNINTQAGCWRGLAVACDKLVFVAIQIEIEWVARVRIDDHHVSVGHQQFAELQAVAAIGHIVLRGNLDPWILFRLAKNLHDVVAFKMNVGDLAGNPRRRKDLSGIKNQVVLFHLYATYFAVLDQVGDLHSNQVHQSLH